MIQDGKRKNYRFKDRQRNIKFHQAFITIIYVYELRILLPKKNEAKADAIEKKSIRQIKTDCWELQYPIVNNR